MQTIEQLKLALKILEEKLEWEYRVRQNPPNEYAYGFLRQELPDAYGSSRYEYSQWYPGRVENNFGVIIQNISNPNHELRIKKKEFPKLPAGQEWHNPDNLKPGDIPAGMRLFTKSEMQTTSKVELKPTNVWGKNYKMWLVVISSQLNLGMDYTWVTDLSRNLVTVTEHKFI